MTERADYGLDAPVVQRNLALAGAACLLIALAVPAIRPGLPASGFLWPGVAMLGTALVMYWSSRVGKFGLRDRVIDAIPWRGDERVLDVGCGRGLALIAAAKRLTRGQAIGVDIWSQGDLSANSAEATRANAAAEGVADRVRVRDGDATALPFEDAAFDAVVSMTCIHNIPTAAGRAQAMREMARVLKPGGRLSMFDIGPIGACARELQAAGMVDVRLTGFVMLWLMPGRRLTARKPDR